MSLGVNIPAVRLGVHLEDRVFTKEANVNTQADILDRVVHHALSGEGAHVDVSKVFDGLDWTLAGKRPAKGTHSVFEVLMHVAYWEDWGVKWCHGEKPPIPKHASGCWTKAPAPKNAMEWKRTVDNFQRRHAELESCVDEADLSEVIGQKSRLEMLQALASHTSYHVGQVVLLRQMLGSWPPPSGGLTW